MSKFLSSLIIFTLLFVSLAFAGNDRNYCEEKYLANIAFDGDASLVKYLNEIESKKRDSLDPFQLLFVKNHKKALERKLNSGFDINSCGGPFDSSLLGLAAMLGELDDVKTIIEHGANLEFPRDSSGQSALILAIDASQYEVAKYLLKKGAKLESSYGNEYEYSALNVLAHSLPYKRHNETEELNLARELMAKGLSPNKMDKAPNVWMTPLMSAIISDKPALVKLFMECGADPYIKDKRGKDSFHFARTRDSFNSAKNKEKKEKMMDILQQPRSASGSCIKAP
ncbi:MAG: ankyrin repeat domain-containing protein [Proteobacteria bacterium]|nr:ankyrin repeat domain-containing protein [Pseudomonadota bacterium]